MTKQWLQTVCEKLTLAAKVYPSTLPNPSFLNVSEWPGFFHFKHAALLSVWGATQPRAAFWGSRAPQACHTQLCVYKERCLEKVALPLGECFTYCLGETGQDKFLPWPLAFVWALSSQGGTGCCYRTYQSSQFHSGAMGIKMWELKLFSVLGWVLPPGFSLQSGIALEWLWLA